MAKQRSELGEPLSLVAQQGMDVQRLLAFVEAWSLPMAGQARDHPETQPVKEGDLEAPQKQSPALTGGSFPGSESRSRQAGPHKGEWIAEAWVPVGRQVPGLAVTACWVGMVATLASQVRVQPCRLFCGSGPDLPWRAAERCESGAAGTGGGWRAAAVPPAPGQGVPVLWLPRTWSLRCLVARLFLVVSGSSLPSPAGLLCRRMALPRPLGEDGFQQAPLAKPRTPLPVLSLGWA